MSNAVHNAVKQCNVRALVSPGWAGLSGASHNKSGAADELKKEEDVFLLEDVPHDWLFTRVDAVVHHGGALVHPPSLFPEASLKLARRLRVGAGTTAIGLLNGLPTGSFSSISGYHTPFDQTILLMQSILFICPSYQ